ncbi:MAG: HAD-IC family P-type ATPase, partial [Firmicutes bacterium]|nr:HAD-IC family P-type ATPase [Bacillota bacterium]
MQKFGLSKVEVERNREEYGKNVLPKKKEKSFLRSYLSAFDDPIIKILLVALAISIFFAFTGGEIFETLGILSSILLATTVATISERGGQSAFKKLKKEAEEIKCRVLREGTITILPISEVVTNDIVLLEAGEKVPADGVIIDGECLVNQAALNGETKEATKTVGARPETSPSQSGRSQVRPLHTAHEVQVDFLSPSHVFMGTVVTSGVAKMRVTAVGKNTEYGRLAMELVDDLRESPLRHRLTKLAIILSRIGYGVAVFVGLSYLFNIFFLSSGFSWDLAYIVRHVFYALTLSVSIVVIAVPEGLPMMISVVLSSNMKKMLKDKILVRKLVSIETMGSLNMLFFDKTGTITKGKLEAKKFVTLDENDENSPFLRARLLRNCVYNNSSSLVEEDGKAKIFGGNSTDRALLAYALNSEKVVGLDVETEVISKTEFNSTDKFSSITIKQNGEVITYLKGSPEKLLPCCDIGLEEKKEFEERLKNYAKQGFRILLFCENSELIGAILLKDEMRDEASLTIESLKKAGIQPVMLTGDAKETAV